MLKLKNQFKPVHAIAVPMVLSAISLPLLGIVDTAILGHLDSEIYLASVNIGSSALNMLLWGLGFLRMSTTGLIAQSHGANNPTQSAQHMARALFLATFLGLSLVVLQPVLIPLQLYLLSNGGDVALLATDYMHIRYFAMPFSLLLFVMNGYFLATNQAGKVLKLMLVSQITNILLDALFVLVFHWDVKGVALGSLISEMSAVSLGGYWLVKSQILDKHHFHQLWRKHSPNNTEHSWLNFFKLNSDIFIRTACLITVFTYMTKQSAIQGDLILASNAVLMNFFYLTAYGLDGYAHAVESICGRHLGNKNHKQLAESFYASMFFAGTMSLFLSLMFLFFGQSIIDQLTHLENIRSTATDYLPWVIVLPVISFSAFVYDGLCIGTTQSKAMRNAMLLSVFAGFIPTWYLLSYYFPDHLNHMLWLSFSLFFILRGVGMYWFCESFVDSDGDTLKNIELEQNAQ
ncbi:MATE family efflux transporter [Marinicella rhabdoformis]|uniref:MATE family efflux transporter n=1 Tax=Marinicella rhabdoformis TaxID=2580566 RepID=UPI0012AED2DA|nr:MATE family efflux transporter [Marinicella rhabdoformis]